MMRTKRELICNGLGTVCVEDDQPHPRRWARYLALIFIPLALLFVYLGMWGSNKQRLARGQPFIYGTGWWMKLWKVSKPNDQENGLTISNPTPIFISRNVHQVDEKQAFNFPPPEKAILRTHSL